MQPAVNWAAEWERSVLDQAERIKRQAERTPCSIDGVEYADIPIFKGEPAFWDDGGPNPNFDWDGFAERIKASKVRNGSARQ